MTASRPIILGMTGASGADYGLRLLQCLLEAGHPVQLLISKAAQIVIHMETELRLPGRPRDIQQVLIEHYRCDPGQLRVYGQDEWTAPPASGSALTRAMVVCPCTTGALADAVVLYQAPDLGWNLGAVAAALGPRGQLCHSLDETLAAIQAQAKPGTQVLIMSNGGFGGIHERLLNALRITAVDG